MVYGSYFHFFCTSLWPVYTLEFYVGVDFIDDLVFRRGQVLLHGNVHLIRGQVWFSVNFFACLISGIKWILSERYKVAKQKLRKH